MTVSAASLLRVVSVVALLQFAGHATMFLRATPTHGPAEVAVVDAMRSHRFPFAAAPRSYWEMYFGYGLEAAAVCLVEAVALWLLAGLAAGGPPGGSAAVRPFALLLIAANVAHLAMLWRYFAFPVPMAFDALIVLGLMGVLFVV